MLGQPVEKLFNHVKVVLAHFAPGARHNFSSLHHKHILTSLRAKSGRFPTIINVFSQLGLSWQLPFAQITRNRVGQVVAKFVGSKARIRAQLDRLGLVNDEFGFYGFFVGADCTRRNFVFDWFAKMPLFIFLQAFLHTKVLELALVACKKKS